MSIAALKQLHEATARIIELMEQRSFDPVPCARRIPEREKRAIEAAVILQSTPAQVRELLADAQANLAAARYELGRGLRDKQLKHFADEIESLRAILCSTAAQASIDAGVYARALRDEAEEFRP